LRQVPHIEGQICIRGEGFDWSRAIDFIKNLYKG
jgi:hypothetical protein